MFSHHNHDHLHGTQNLIDMCQTDIKEYIASLSNRLRPLPPGVGPQGRIAVGVEIPALAATDPDGLAHTLTQVVIEALLGLLSFTLFEIQFEVKGSTAIFAFAPGMPIPDDLMQYYTDRDASAVSLTGEFALGKNFPVDKVTLAHHHDEYRTEYEARLGCAVEFGDSRTTVQFPASVLETPMPLRDAETSSLYQQQCQRLLARLSKQSGFVEEVRALIVARPGFFPDIDYVAEKLKVSTRTLRRKLGEEGGSYQQILDEVRYSLARDYLTNSTLPLEEISIMLGCSTAGNFSAAFKRWHGNAPRQFRQEAFA